jgi:hypothetical protein
MSLSTATKADMVSTLGGLGVYDTDLDITWLANANAGAATAFDDGISTTDGMMSWQNASNWVASLTVGGFTEWRLPTTLQPDPSCGNQVPTSNGQNCTGSEMGHLFHNELGGTSFNSMLLSGDPDLVKFTNFPNSPPDIVYWSSTAVAGFPDNAYDFNITIGKQFSAGKTISLYAWAVHDGNIGAVPVPAAIWLFGSGLLGLVGMARRKKIA